METTFSTQKHQHGAPVKPFEALTMSDGAPGHGVAHSRPSQTRSQGQSGDADVNTNHDILNQPSQDQASLSIDRESINDVFVRLMAGGFVKFGRGGAVKDLRLASDFSAVEIKGFSPERDEASIGRLLETLGFKDWYHIQKLSSREEGPSSGRALVIFDHPDHAEMFIGMVLATASGVTFTAQVAPLSCPSSETTHKIGYQKLSLSWATPGPIFYLTFETPKKAKRVHRKFREGIYTVLGHRVSIGQPFEETADDGSSLQWLFSLAAPPTATILDVLQAISEKKDEPQESCLHENAYPGDLKDILAQHMPFRVRVGAISHSVHGFSTAIAEFDSDQEAWWAYKDLHETPECIGVDGQVLFYNPIYTARIKVPGRVFSFGQVEVASLTDEWRTEGVFVETFHGVDTPDRFVTCEVQSQVKHRVEEAVRMLEAIFAGNLVLDATANGWSESLWNNCDVLKKLKDIEQQYGVVLVVKKWKQQVVYFGRPGLEHQLQTAIVKQVYERLSPRHHIPINAGEFIRLHIGGYQRICQIVGGDDVDVIDAINARQIVLRRSPATAQEIESIVRLQPDFTVDQNPQHQDQSCTICWRSPNEFVQLGCGHAYCPDCFALLCVINQDPSQRPEVACYGNLGKCRYIPHLRELQYLMSSSAFEELLEAGLAAYVDRRSDELKYCATPNCGVVYRANPEDPQSLPCTKCRHMNCTGCFQRHPPGFLCAAFEALAPEDRKRLSRDTAPQMVEQVFAIPGERPNDYYIYD